MFQTLVEFTVFGSHTGHTPPLHRWGKIWRGGVDQGSNSTPPHQISPQSVQSVPPMLGKPQNRPRSNLNTGIMPLRHLGCW